jgi:hypothetical protein
MKNIFILLALAVGFTFTSCSKDDDAAPTKTEMLTGKNWKVTAETVSVNNGTPSDVYTMASACEKDNSINFASDGKFTFDEGASKCAANEPQTQTGTWSFENGETVLKMTQGTSTANQTITELSASKMVLTVDDTFTTGGTTTTYKYVTTYEVQ